MPQDAAPRQAAPRQQARGDIYLPAMPDILNAPRQPATALPSAYAAATPQPAPAGPKVVIRGQAPEEAPPPPPPPPAPTRLVKLTIPTPEDLGLLPPEAAAPPPVRRSPPVQNWNEARERLDQMGALGYRLEKAPGGFRFACDLPAPLEAARQRHFEAQAVTELEALRQVLEQIERWRAGS